MDYPEVPIRGLQGSSPTPNNDHSNGDPVSQSLDLGGDSSTLPEAAAPLGFFIRPCAGRSRAMACAVVGIQGNGDPELVPALAEPLSFLPSFPQAGAVLGTPPSCRTKSEYSCLLLLIPSSLPSFSIARSCVPSALCSLNLLCPFSHWDTPIIPAFTSGVAPTVILEKLFVPENPNSSSEEQDSYFSI